MSDGTQKEQVCVHIRWMIRRDMPEVLQAEQESFDHAWTEEDFCRCLRQRNCIGMVAEQGERVMGFMIYELHKNRLHVLKFAVHPHFRRRGVGRQMVAKLISKLSVHRRTRITLEIRRSDAMAGQFFGSCDFQVTKELPLFYQQPSEDGMLLEHRLPGTEDWSQLILDED